MKHSLYYQNQIVFKQYQLYKLRLQSQGELNPTSYIIYWWPMSGQALD